MDAGLITTQLAARPSARRRHERLTGIVAAMARQTVTASFEIIAWDERPAGVEGHGAAVVRRRFRGPLQATSVAELLAVETAHGTSYVASERVEGTLDGRSGSFVIQHGGITGAGPGRTFGHVVPGSGTGDLEGLMGDAAFARDDAGTRLTLSYKL